MALTKITSRMTDDTIPQKTAHGAMKLPVGATAQRPTGEAGDLRYNSTTGEFEGYTTEWGSIGGGGIGAEYISATPTLSSSVNNQIVIGNYSSYVSPVFITKIGSTVIPHTDNSGTLRIAPPTSFSGTQTVSVEAFDLGKLYSASATVSVGIINLTARYWRLTNQVNGSSTDYRKPIYKAWQLFPSLDGGGTKRGSASAITASYNYGSYNVQNLYAGTTSIAWYLHNSSGTLASHWVQYDLGSAQEVLSMKWTNYSSAVDYYASSFTIQNSSDGTNWDDIKQITQTGGGATLRTINL